MGKVVELLDKHENVNKSERPSVSMYYIDVHSSNQRINILRTNHLLKDITLARYAYDYGQKEYTSLLRFYQARMFDLYQEQLES